MKRLARDAPAVFEWLFPTWSDPQALALVVLGRLVLDASLTAIVARTFGRRSAVTAVAAAVTIGSAVTMVLVLRPGTLGTNAANVELLAQLGLLGVAGYAVARTPSAPRIGAFALVGVAALALWLLSIPIYGEATVAP